MLSLTPDPNPDPDRRPAVLSWVPRCGRRASVSCTQTWHLLPTSADAHPVPVRVRLTWTAHEPHAVAVAFRTGAKPVVWLVARDLLTAGLSGPAGLGDVTVIPDMSDPDMGELMLSGIGGQACFRFRAAEVAGFLDRLPDPPALSPAVHALLAGVARHGGDTGQGWAA